MDEAPRTEAQEYSANLDLTLRELQRKVAEHEKELQKVCPSLNASEGSPEVSLVGGNGDSKI